MAFKFIRNKNEEVNQVEEKENGQNQEVLDINEIKIVIDELFGDNSGENLDNEQLSEQPKTEIDLSAVRKKVEDEKVKEPVLNEDEIQKTENQEIEKQEADKPEKIKLSRVKLKKEKEENKQEPVILKDTQKKQTKKKSFKFKLPKDSFKKKNAKKTKEVVVEEKKTTENKDPLFLFNFQNQNPKEEEETKHEFFFNEHDYSQVLVKLSRINSIKNRKRLKMISIVAVILLVIGFFLSPLSRIRKIYVVGSVYLSEEEVIKMSKVEKDDFYLTTFPFLIERNLNSMPMIESTKVKKSIFDGIRIEVVEKKVIGYMLDETELKLVDTSGKVTSCPKDFLANIQSVPSITNFQDSQEKLEKFLTEYAKIPSYVIALISDIVYAPVDPYDINRVLFNMADGKKVYVRIEDMAKEMQHYQEILSSSPDACQYDILGNKVYVKSCD